MRAVLALSLLGMIGIGACTDERPEPPQPPDIECQPPGAHFAFLETDTQVYRQGATIRLTPRVNSMPFGTPELPLRCTSDWRVTGPATLSVDRSVLTIAPDAVPGAVVTVAFRRGEEEVGARFTVVGRDEVVLTGARTQRALEGCTGADRVGELQFSPGNRFSVTFQPFESYRDYWGSYSYDPVTKRLRMTAEGGNFVPPRLDLDGEAELGPEGLVLRDMFLGSRHGASPTGSCIYRF